MLGSNSKVTKEEYEKCTPYFEQEFMKDLKHILCSNNVSKKKFNDMDTAIRNAFQNAQKKDQKIRYRRKEVLKIYDQNIGALKKDFPFDVLYKNDWECPDMIEVHGNDQFATKALKEAMFYRINSIKNDIKTLKQEILDKLKFQEAFAFYKSTLDIEQTMEKFGQETEITISVKGRDFLLVISDLQKVEGVQVKKVH